MPTAAPGTYQPASASYLDAGGEHGNTAGLFGKIITAANHDAQNTLWEAVITAISALSLGAITRKTYADKVTFNPARPTNGAAREVSLRMRWRDGTSGTSGIIRAVPCVNLALISYIANEDARDVVDMTTTEVAALIDALEAFQVDPEHEANLVTITSARVVRGQK